MLKPVDIFMVGVGGQGTILASKVLAAAARAVGYDVKMSEIHGMAQRGGSVVTQVRLGEKVHSPLISEGEADVILAFEQLEALRWLSYLKPGGIVIINNQKIYPVPVLAGAAEYPADIIEQIKGKVNDVLVLDALQQAIQCGNAKAANVVLLGAMARELPIKEEIWREALAATVPPKFLEINNAAFTAGYNSRS
ncbi:indolepyruvate ferredoxin oxidoreductase beta subunit [Desulfotomaculum arcticum]|uniref:Indolepyruvate ferredoxin oxidoreductase beta subunit n=1 Tax=Desulfotruncus arcticus DSM 17038 TaxID=1121424 RepID=A0A1I2VE84_9FIRM|nr:indolepyruvate oxidoreductase subunit beta [Desulfotruncus arcticus]SFG87654.1 indolepyruvate ferredoxin oxidoreductase beta subunit [Desulfotomaculum arcticum] [Desulfotruncus arcticus DSM 17038]